MDRQDVFRWLMTTRAFTAAYGSMIGPASARMFTPILQADVLAALPAGARVLEVGCGPGLQALEVARLRPDLRLVASDFSEQFVLAARRRAEAAGLGTLELAVADAMDLSRFEDASFDAVYSLTAIKHFPDPVRGLKECLRVLRLGGLLFVAEIRRESTAAEVRVLTELFDAPALVRAIAARGVHGNLRLECPAIETVQQWFAAALPGAVAIEPLPGLPAWKAVVRRKM
jgi:ubiquinone/menaquinone biosynthesis C-methylase UbiE